MTKIILYILCLLSLQSFSIHAQDEHNEVYIVDNEAKYLTMISYRLFGTIQYWQQIAEWNNLVPPYGLKQGQELIIKKAPIISKEDGNQLIFEFWKKKLGEAPTFQLKTITLDQSDPKLKSISVDINKSYGFKVAIGNTYTTIQQTSTEKFKVNLLTTNIQYERNKIFDNFIFIASATYKGPILSATPDINIKFLSATTNIGYILPFFSSPLEISINAGLFYRTVISNDKTFGYRDLTQFQFMPRASWTFKNQNVISSYVKYTSLDDGFNIIPKDQKELEVNLTWKMKRNYPIFLALNYYNLVFDVNETSRLTTNEYEFLFGTEF